MPAPLIQDGLYADLANCCHGSLLMLRGPIVQVKLRIWICNMKEISRFLNAHLKYTVPTKPIGRPPPTQIANVKPLN